MRADTNLYLDHRPQTPRNARGSLRATMRALPARFHLARILVLALISAVVISGYWKAFVPEIWGMRAYFWLITYQIGLVRRGLLGTALTPIRNEFASTEAYLRGVSTFYHVAMPATLIALFAWATIKTLASHRRDVQVLGTSALFLLAAAPMVSNQGFNSGWLDGFFMGFSAICFVLVRRGFYLTAASLAFGIMFVHELSLFFWTPSAALIVAHAFRRTPRPNLAVCAIAIVLPILAGAVIGFFETRQSVEAAIGAMTLDDATKRLLLGEQFAHTPSSVFLTQVRLISEYPRNYLWSCLYGLSPSLLAVVVALALAPSRDLVGKLLLAMIGFSVWSALPLQWDLTRSMGWTGIAALLLLVEVAAPSAHYGDLGPAPSRVSVQAKLAAVAILTLALVYARSPLIYTYFEVADYIGPPEDSFLTDRDGVFAKTAAKFASVYSRGHERPDLVSAPVRFSCELNGSAKREQGPAGCDYDITPSTNVYGPYRRFRAGDYVAKFHLSPNESCSTGRAALEVVVRGNVVQRSEADPAKQREAGLPFSLDAIDEVSRPLEFRVIGSAGCVRLSDVTVEPVSK